MSGGDLCVRSPHRVYRRYVDASELMDVAMRLGLASRSVAFDSGGTYVELEDLADLILTEIGQPGMRVRRESPPDGLMDDYSADDSVFRDLAASMGVHITDLQGQIVRTARAFRPGFHKMDPRTDPS